MHKGTPRCIYTTPNSFRIREACCTVPVNRLSRPLFSVRVLARACSGTRTQGWPDHEKVDAFRHVNGTVLELQRWHQPQPKKTCEEFRGAQALGKRVTGLVKLSLGCGA